MPSAMLLHVFPLKCIVLPGSSLNTSAAACGNKEKSKEFYENGQRHACPRCLSQNATNQIRQPTNTGKALKACHGQSKSWWSSDEMSLAFEATRGENTLFCRMGLLPHQTPFTTEAFEATRGEIAASEATRGEIAEVLREIPARSYGKAAGFGEIAARSSGNPCEVLRESGLNGTWEALRLKILQVLEAAMLWISYYSIIVPQVPWWPQRLQTPCKRSGESNPFCKKACSSFSFLNGTWLTGKQL